MTNEHVIRHESNHLGQLKSSLSRLQAGLFGAGDKTKHKFIITKTDGSQRMVVGNYIEFDTVNKTIELFRSTGHVNGTIMKDIEEVEEVE